MAYKATPRLTKCRGTPWLTKLLQGLQCVEVLHGLQSVYLQGVEVILKSQSMI